MTLENKTDDREFRLKIKHEGNQLIDGTISKYGGTPDDQPISYILYNNPNNNDANHLNRIVMSKTIIEIEIRRKLGTLRTEDAYSEYQIIYFQNLDKIHSETNPR